MISSKDLLRKTEIGSNRTLIRWHQGGLIPPPTVTTHPSGRGKMSYWPDWVVDRCKRIATMKKQGHSLMAIKTALGIDWDREDKIWAHRSTATVDAGSQHLTKRFRKRLAQQVWARIGRVVGSAAIDGGALHDATVGRLLKEGVLERGVDQAQQGYSVFIVFDGFDLSVVPDFALAHRLAIDVGDEGGFLVIPLWPMLQALAKEHDIEIPEHPSHFPCSRVSVGEYGSTRDVDFRLDGRSGVRVAHPPALVGARPIPEKGKKRRNILGRSKKP